MHGLIVESEQAASNTYTLHVTWAPVVRDSGKLTRMCMVSSPPAPPLFPLSVCEWLSPSLTYSCVFSIYPLSIYICALARTPFDLHPS